jgi:group I intron endonuclease
MQNNNWTVYCHICPNGKRYIGITNCTVNTRWGKDGKGYKKQVFYNAIKKYGWDNIKHEIIAEGVSKEVAEEKEIELIKEYKTLNSENGYNCAIGGNVNSGFKMPETAKETLRLLKTGTHHNKETRDKMSKDRKGEKAYWYGKKHSKETKAKLSEIKTGEKNPNFGKKIHSEEHLKKLSDRMSGKNNPMYGKGDLLSGINNPMYGKKHSEETKRKYSENRKGSNNGNSRKVCQYDAEGNLIKVWDYINQAVAELGLSTKNGIIACCRGRQKTAHGFKWSYFVVKS